MMGPGKYDKACTQARKDTGAHTIILIVLGGKEGEGFSVQSKIPGANLFLPQLLREVAKRIETIETN